MIFSAFAQGRAMCARRFPTSRPYCANLGAPREYSPKRAKAGDPMTEYYIPTQAGEAELVEKRSRFIGHVWRVESEEEARARIEEMKKRYYDARHNCWCYLLREGPVRYSDDGEPQGTAGQPMLNVFQREEVTNVCCVVTRYFGGILLGAGGAGPGLYSKRQGCPGRRRHLGGAPLGGDAGALSIQPFGAPEVGDRRLGRRDPGDGVRG